MKLLYVAHNAADDRKGAAHADLSLMSALRTRGHDVDEEWDVCSSRAIAHGNLHLLLEAPRACALAVARRCSQRRYDVVIVNQPLGWRAGRLVKREHHGTLYLVRSHGWEPRVANDPAVAAATQRNKRSRSRRVASLFLKPFLLRQNSLALEHADGVVVGTMADKEWLVTRGGFDRDRVLALAPGIPVEFLAADPLAMTKQRLRKILSVGQYQPVKDPRTIADVMSSVLMTCPEASASWVCEVEWHDTAASLLVASVRNRVSLRGWLPRNELRQVYDDHGIYLFPSLFEGYGQTFLEAMSRGLIVLANQAGGMAETIRDGENGFLFRRGDVAGMAERTVWLMAHPGEAQQLSSAARDTSRAFSWERAATAFEEFVESLRSMGAPRGTR